MANGFSKRLMQPSGPLSPSPYLRYAALMPVSDVLISKVHFNKEKQGLFLLHDILTTSDLFSVTQINVFRNHPHIRGFLVGLVSFF